MSQQDAAKEQATTRNNLRIVSLFAAAAIGIVGVLVILYAWQLPPFTRHTQFTDNAYVRGQTTFISPQVNGYITEVNVQDFVQVKKGDLLLQPASAKARAPAAVATLPPMICRSGYLARVSRIRCKTPSEDQTD